MIQQWMLQYNTAPNNLSGNITHPFFKGENSFVGQLNPFLFWMIKFPVLPQDFLLQSIMAAT